MYYDVMLGRTVLPDGKEIGLFLPVIFVMLLLAAGASWWWQRGQFYQEKQRLDELSLEAVERVETSKLTAARLPEFRREFERKQKLLEAQRLALPRSLVVPSFIAELEDWVEGFSVSVESYRFRQVRSEGCDACEEAVITLRWSGSRQAIDALLENRDAHGRFVHWRGVDHAGERAESTLSIFALKTRAARKRTPCSGKTETSSSSWFWPYTNALERERSRVEQLCDELERLGPIDLMLEEYRSMLEQSEELAVALTQLRELEAVAGLEIRTTPSGKRSPLDEEPPPITVSTETSRITEPLLANGAPDYAAELNGKLGKGVTPELNAANMLVPALGLKLDAEVLSRMGVEPGSPEVRPFFGGILRTEELAAYLQERADRGEGPEPPKDLETRFLEQFSVATAGPWSEQDCPLIAEWLRGNENALALIADATQKPMYWVPLREGEDWYLSPSPSLFPTRNVGQALQARALQRLRENDWSGAADDVVILHRLGSLVGRGLFLVDALFGIVLRGFASESMSFLAASPDLTAEDAHRILRQLNEAPRPRTLAELETTERYTSLAGVFSLHEIGARHGPGAWKEALEIGDQEFYRKPPGLYQIDISAIDWNEALGIVNHHWDRELAVYLDPYVARGSLDDEFAWIASARDTLDDGDRLQALIERAPHDAEARTELTRAFLAGAGIVSENSMRGATMSFNESATQTQLGIAALALAAYQDENGKWPGRLDELVPSFVAEPPPLGYWKGYDFRYHTDPPESSDPDVVRSFAYTAAPRTIGVHGSGSFCVDASGARVVTYDGREPEVLDARCVAPSQ